MVVCERVCSCWGDCDVKNVTIAVNCTNNPVTFLFFLFFKSYRQSELPWQDSSLHELIWWVTVYSVTTSNSFRYFFSFFSSVLWYVYCGSNYTKSVTVTVSLTLQVVCFITFLIPYFPQRLFLISSVPIFWFYELISVYILSCLDLPSSSSFMCCSQGLKRQRLNSARLAICTAHTFSGHFTVCVDKMVIWLEAL